MMKGPRAHGAAAADTDNPRALPRALAASIVHPLTLDLEWIRSVLDGRTGNGGAEPEHPAVAGLHKALATIRPANARTRELGRRLIHQRHLWFCFKVVYRSDETREDLLSVLADPVTEEVFPLPSVPGGRDALLDDDAPLDGYPLRRLYERACRVVARAVQLRGRRYQEAARRRLERDLVRLDEYYEALREEALEPVARELHRLEAAHNRERLWRALGVSAAGAAGTTPEGPGQALDELQRRARDIVAALAEDRRRRVQELREKYRVRAEVTLLAAARLWVPRVELRWKLMGAARREITFYYDPLRGRCVDLTCDTCGRTLKVVFLCRSGDLACEHCFAPCAGCGQPLCQGCAPKRCHLCDAPLCGGCGTGCPLSLALTASPLDAPLDSLRSAYHVCPACRAQTCSVCAALAGGTAV